MPLDPSHIPAAREALRVAKAHLDEIPRERWADIFDFASAILDGEEAEDASRCAFHLREAERLQTRLFL